MKSKTLLAGLLLTAGLATATVAMANESNSSLLVIREQGSFAAGGTVIPAREPYNPLKPQAAGQTLHGDHAYVFYQIPADARKYPWSFCTERASQPRRGKPHRTDAKVFRIFFCVGDSAFI